MTRTAFLTLALSLAVSPVLAAAPTEAPLGVHEWGTFTALQNDAGLALPGINVDDESLPTFVHDVNSRILHRPFSIGNQSKGAPERHPYVTLRLETPVVYFHLPPGAARMNVNLDVALRGGWLTQFYPSANVSFPGMDQVKDENDELKFGAITPSTVGRLSWRDVTVGASGDGPDTDRSVWIAPRKVAADSVATPDHETEKYLFYRGVGNFPAPLQIVSHYRDGDRELEMHARFEDVLSGDQRAHIGRIWVVDIHPDGQAAYRGLDGRDVTGDPQAVVAKASADFTAADFSEKAMERLREELHAALVLEGLNGDEATALVETWKQAYFKSPGLRVFFVVPRVWTDYHLPLKVSVPSEIHRAMVGRIELISGEQRDLLKKLSATSQLSNPSWIYQIKDGAAAQRFYSGHSDFGDLGVTIPDDFRTYLSLGRFRDALILNEQKEHPSKTLSQFIAQYDLQFFDVPTSTTAASPTRSHASAP